MRKRCSASTLRIIFQEAFWRATHMQRATALSLVGDNVRHFNVSVEELNAIVLKLRNQGFHIQAFQKGFDCEESGVQVFRATELETFNRYHVRLNARMFPDV